MHLFNVNPETTFQGMITSKNLIFAESEVYILISCSPRKFEEFISKPDKSTFGENWVFNIIVQNYIRV